MECNYSNSYLIDLLHKQLSMFLITDDEVKQIENTLVETLERTNYCFSKSKNKYYSYGGKTFFNPFHSGQWCIFLYFLSNSIYRKDSFNRAICDKIYYLNRMLNSVDLFYEVNMPSIFMLDHPLGTVIGRGTFGDYFSFSQGCTVGNNKGVFPVFEENVNMLSNSKVLGNSRIGKNVIISANTYIKDQDVESNVIVFGSSPNLIFKLRKYV
mgnify:CR=1 FL=1|jgi:serine O-acetyltransferase